MQIPYNMPPGFEWCTLNVTDPNEILEVYQLLTENYVEDDDCHFRFCLVFFFCFISSFPHRFDYSTSFLQWALTPPGFVPDWHVGVRATKSRLNTYPF
jgi:glycylpeptide N-tetradecanoyltransferase